eukprot:5208094-Prymnesium_polylepis.2
MPVQARSSRPTRGLPRAASCEAASAASWASAWPFRRANGAGGCPRARREGIVSRRSASPGSPACRA